MKSIKESIKDSIELQKLVLSGLAPEIGRAIQLLKECIMKKNKILIAGNGGSSSQSSHMAAELVGRYKKERGAIACIALTTDTSILTAWSNDFSFDTVFSRQIEAIGNKDDIFIAISTSGNSKNVIMAVEKCKALGIKTVGLLGNDGGILKKIVDFGIIVPSIDTPRIQESHLMIIHILCEALDG